MRHSKAFTLIELAIVLAIIGLIAAGISTASTLVNSAKVRAQVSQLRKIEAAYFSFRAAYGYRPGDFSEATSFWGTAANGDGNGIITPASGDNYLSAYDGEITNFFHHLSVSGMLSETYSPNSYTPEVGSPVPSLSPNSTYSFLAIPRLRTESDGCFGLNNCVPAANQVGTFLYGLRTSGPGNVGLSGAANMRAVDLKTDDGIPATGKFLGIGYWSAYCANTAVSPNQYFSTQGLDCVFMYRLE